MRKAIAVIGMILGAASIAGAQNPGEPMCVIDGNQHPASDCGPGGPRPPADPLARYFFPPELIMANQQAIQLTDNQRDSLQHAMADAQGKFIPLQFKMSSEVEGLQNLLKKPGPVDEAQVLEQVDRVLAVERDVKRAQLSLMVRIRNMLTPIQRARLTSLRSHAPNE
jgi:Spy/CpxP family protein refolding chaperone